MNKLTLDRWAPIGASVATLGIDLSYIPAEPNVKFKGNRHVTRVKSQLTVVDLNCPWCKYFLSRALFGIIGDVPRRYEIAFRSPVRYFVNTPPQTPVRSRYHSIRYAGACIVL